MRRHDRRGSATLENLIVVMATFLTLAVIIGLVQLGLLWTVAQASAGHAARAAVVWVAEGEPGRAQSAALHAAAGTVALALASSAEGAAEDALGAWRLRQACAESLTSVRLDGVRGGATVDLDDLGPGDPLRAVVRLDLPPDSLAARVGLNITVAAVGVFAVPVGGGSDALP